MKTFFTDYAMDDTLVGNNTDLEYVISNRQEKFRYTAVYQEEREKVISTLGKILNTFSGDKSIDDIAERIAEAFFVLESICYSAAYRDGMSDLITAMTFNKLGITKAEYIDTSKSA